MEEGEKGENGEGVGDEEVREGDEGGWADGGGEAEAGGGEGAGGVTGEEEAGRAGGVGDEREEDVLDDFLIVGCLCFTTVEKRQSRSSASVLVLELSVKLRRLVALAVPLTSTTAIRCSRPHRDCRTGKLSTHPLPTHA